MKKFLLSLGALAVAFISNATVYTLFDQAIDESGWTVNADDQFELQTSLRGADFTIVTAKDPRSSSYKPGIIGAPLRLRDNCALSISSSVEMKMVRFTYASMSTTYVAQGTVAEGWVQDDIIEDTKSDTPFSMLITNAEGSKEFTFTSTEKYIMLAKIEVTDTNFDDNGPSHDAELESLADITEKNLQPGDIVSVNFDMTVAYVYGTTLYAADQNGAFIKISGPTEYEKNYVINSGWTGTYKLDNGYFPVLYASDNFPKPNPNSTGVVTPRVVEASVLADPMNLNELANNEFIINGVELTTPTPYDPEGLYNDIPFKGTSNNVELTFCNEFNIGSVNAGFYNITVIFGEIEKDSEGNVTPVLYVVKFEKSTETGIQDLSADAADNVEAEYYTLQGVKTANMEKGMYIRVRNGKASKVIVK